MWWTGFVMRWGRGRERSGLAEGAVWPVPLLPGARGLPAVATGSRVVHGAVGRAAAPSPAAVPGEPGAARAGALLRIAPPAIRFGRAAQVSVCPAPQGSGPDYGRTARDPQPGGRTRPLVGGLTSGPPATCRWARCDDGSESSPLAADRLGGTERRQPRCGPDPAPW
jgi:hypothetical protein